MMSNRPNRTTLSAEELLKRYAAGERQFPDVILREGNLTGASLRSIVLSGSDLRGAKFRNANLIEADLERANLRGADLRGADLRGANLTQTELEEAYFNPSTYFDAGFDPVNRGMEMMG